jgi:hypothetical protein
MSLQTRAGEIKRAKTVERPEDAASASQPRTPTGWHPYQDGGLTTVTDYAFHIAGADAAASPFNDIADEDLVIVGVGAVSTYGGSLVDQAANLWQVRGNVTGPWQQNLGILGVAGYIGMNVAGRTPDQLTQDEIAQGLGRHGSAQARARQRKRRPSACVMKSTRAATKCFWAPSTSSTRTPI